MGKSNLIFRYVHGKWNDKNLTTVGVEFMSKEVEFHGEKYKLQIWDTAGEELFKSIAANFYKECHAVILCYDVTNRKSFDNLSFWVREIQNNAHRDCIGVVAGTKIDLAADRVVSSKEGLDFAGRHGFLFFEISALKNSEEGVEKMFDALVTKMTGVYADDAKKSLFHQKHLTFSKADPQGGEVTSADCCSQ